MAEAPPRLNAGTAGGLPPDVRRPGYDRSATTVRVAHLGVGAFHRCHQAEYLEDVLEGGDDDAAMVGINLYPPRLSEMLGPQDGLYCRTLCDGEARDRRVIGAIRRVIDGAADPAGAIAALAAAEVTTVTMTVTEKGYCHIPATGRLDEMHPDILADLARGEAAPRSVPGLLVAALAARRGAGAGPVNLVSCDNIAANGRVLENAVRAFAQAVDPALDRWIADNVAFPSTMVDRIVPATTEAGLAEVRAALGVEDRAAVFGEPFRQWVIEDAFRARRPRWETAGAEFVRDVEPSEHVKMRVLNAAQTMLSLYGALAGHVHTFEVARDPAIMAAVERTLREETLPHLPPAPGMEGKAYLARSVGRIANSAIFHRCHQIATDTSQKIRQRLLDPIRARRAVRLAHPGLSRAVAAWIVYLARSGTAFGALWTVSDPVMPRVSAILERRGRDLDGIVAEILDLQDVFGVDLSRAGDFREEVAAEARELLCRGVHPPAPPAAGPERERTA